MAGADPKSGAYDRARRVISPAVARHLRPQAAWRWIAVLAVFLPLSFLLVQCGQAPSAGTLAANVQASAGDSFDDRFPKPQFKDRFPTASESLLERQATDAPNRRDAQAQPAPYRVASLAPTVPYERPAREEQTTLV